MSELSNLLGEFAKSEQVGEISNLETACKSNVVSAINEVKRKVDTAVEFADILSETDPEKTVAQKPNPPSLTGDYTETDTPAKLPEWLSRIITRVGHVLGGAWNAAVPKVTPPVRSGKTDNADLDNLAYHINRQEVSGSYKPVNGQKQIADEDQWMHGATHLPLAKHIVARDAEGKIFSTSKNVDKMRFHTDGSGALTYTATSNLGAPEAKTNTSGDYLPDATKGDTGYENLVLNAASMTRHRNYHVLDHPDGCVTYDKLSPDLQDQVDICNYLKIENGRLMNRTYGEWNAVYTRKEINHTSNYLGVGRQISDMLTSVYTFDTYCPGMGQDGAVIYFSVDKDASDCENGTQLVINGKSYHVTLSSRPEVCNAITMAKKYLYKGIYRNTANNGEEIVVSVF